MLFYHLYLYFSPSWLVPRPPCLQLPLGTNLSSCNITALRTVISPEKDGLPFAKGGINSGLLMEVFVRIQSRQTQYIYSPEYDTCMRRNGLHLRLQIWSQAPKPKIERGHKGLHSDTETQMKLKLILCFPLSLTTYHYLLIICPDSASTTPKQGQCCLSQLFPSSSI